jgi:thiol-disulfide isomerase/thioredoxin
MKQLLIIALVLFGSASLNAQVKNSVPAAKIKESQNTDNIIKDQLKAGKAKLALNVKDFENDTIYFNINNLSAQNDVIEDTLYYTTANNKIEFDIKGPSVVKIYSKKSFLNRKNGKKYLANCRSVTLILKPEQSVSISGKFENNTLIYKVDGDDLNKTFGEMRLKSLKEDALLTNQMLKIDSMQYSGADEKIVDNLWEELDKKQNNLLSDNWKFIRENPNNELSAFFMSSLPMDSIPVYMNLLGANLKEGDFGKYLKDLNAKYKRYEEINLAQKLVSEGKQAPDFSLTSIDGKQIKLSDFKEKFIVIDFWGSWCYWCMKGVPQMKEYYAKYKDKVEFIGIACRDKDAAWRNTVAKNEMNWVQLYNQTKDDASVLYGVTGYPTKFILDKNHKVVFKVIGEDPAFYTKMDELFK